MTIDTFDKEMTLKGTKVDLRDIYEGRPFVCDSFLIFNSFQCPDYYFYAFDLRSGKHVASFCPKGDGPEDYLSCDESAQLIKENGDGYINMRYRISDTGIGMSEEFTKEVFEEFAQEDSGVRTQYHGVGLGMAIVKKYVDMMGGTISVQSKKHEGTTFTVDIPLEITDKECNKADTGISEKVNLTGVNVLIAEDNELNAEIAAVQLEEFGMNVERAVDGKNAVEIFRNHPEGTFDVILMDIMMPEMKGYEAAKAIRAMNDRPDGKNIPIIAMTANSFAEDVQASLDAGMNAHLSKPIVIEEVIKTILRYVHND